jgi:hypothetical protein
MLAMSISVLDFVDLADDLLTTLINHESIPHCHSRIMAVMKGNEDPNYLKTTMAHLRDVQLENDDIWLLQAIVLPLLCVRELEQEVVRMILQPLTEFVWRQPSDVRGLTIGGDKLSEFLNNANADQATTQILVDFITTCWIKNRAENEQNFTGLTGWLLSVRAASGYLLSLSAIIAYGGKPADVAAALRQELIKWHSVNPVNAKKIVDYMHERTKDGRTEWGPAFWVSSVRDFTALWFQKTSDTLIEIFAPLGRDMDLVREIADSCKSIRAGDPSLASVLRRAFVIASAWPDTVPEMKKMIPRGSIAAWGSSADAKKLAPILGSV